MLVVRWHISGGLPDSDSAPQLQLVARICVGMSRSRELENGAGEYSRIPNDELEPCSDKAAKPPPPPGPRAAARGSVSVETTTGNECRDWIGATFVRGDRFQSFVALVILCNAIVIGCETDVPRLNWLWNRFEDSFLLIFFIELLLRLYFLRLKFFLAEGEQVANVFDFTLVAAGVVDYTMTAWGGSLGHFSTVVRFARLLRILRLFRLFKMFKQLYMLASGFADSSVAVFWVSVLCSLCLYVCAVFLTRTLGKQKGSMYQDKFGSVLISMFTLFELMADPNLSDMKGAMFSDPLMMAFFIIFIIFGSFAMLSILTGVISEGMIEKGNTHKEEMRFEEARAKEAFLMKLRHHFQESDVDGDGTMTVDEFGRNLPAMMDMFEEYGFCYSEADLLMVFDLVDFDKGGTVELEEFLQGMTSFTANVSDLPLQALRLQSNIFGRINNYETSLNNSIGAISERLTSSDEMLNSIEDKLATLAIITGRAPYRK